MKKAIAFVSAMLLAMSMAACGSGSSDNAGSQTPAGSAASESGSSENTASTSSGSADADSSSESAAAGDGTVYQIGICQLVQHEALDAATQGFKDALTELMGEGNVEFSEQNASCLLYTSFADGRGGLDLCRRSTSYCFFLRSDSRTNGRLGRCHGD